MGVPERHVLAVAELHHLCLVRLVRHVLVVM
jgi:hypothetical protein